jgi:hypothetical protein
MYLLASGGCLVNAWKLPDGAPVHVMFVSTAFRWLLGECKEVANAKCGHYLYYL